MEKKIQALSNIYKAFEAKNSGYKKDSACKKGCGFCRKEAGSIDITTLEGLVMEVADQSINELQQLDITGYSGHLSYIIYMLSTPAFLNTYKKGDFKPEEIMEFGKAHKIVINKMMGLILPQKNWRMS
jgi:hypothetical protein